MLFTRRLLRSLSLLFALLVGAVPLAHAATFTVTKTADTADGTCNSDCSLREAVYAANATAGTNTITFNATVFAAPRKTITATPSVNISQNVTITAPAAGVVVNSASNYNLFTVGSGVSASFVGLTLTNGHTGVENDGTVTLTNCTLSGNDIGLVNYGDTATLINCTISGSSSDGIYNGTGSGGSGIRFGGSASVAAVTASTANLTNCTVSGNGSAGINNNSGNTVNVENSIVVDNSTDTGGDPITDGGNNILGGTVAAAGLDPTGLQDNGGPAPTIALVSGSPAINAANDANAPATDQRGIARQGAHSDIGAFEATQGIVMRNASANEGNSGTTNFVFTVKLLLPAANDVTVNYATANGTASSASDYTAKSGTLTIPAGATSADITVLVKGDTTIEPDETFYVILSNPVNATIANNRGVGTIIADDFETPSLVVNTTSDVESKTDGLISLRDAVTYANSNPDQSEITFAPTVFAAPRKTITVGSVLTLSENVTITGPAAGVTVEGLNLPNSIFDVKSGKSAGFDGLTISKGVYGILNVAGVATVTNCTLSNNSDTGFYNYSGTATLANCALSGNNFGVLSSFGTADLTNCTLSGNSVFGFSSASTTASLTNCTVSGNIGGIKNTYTGPKITLKNSIVAGNTTNTDGPITYGVNNIAAGTAAAAGLETDGAGQPVLKDNDGPTPTIALVPGGAAIDAADDASAPATDQRGYARPQGAHSDIGAFELAPMVLVIGDVAANEGNSGTTNFVFTVKLLRASVNVVTVAYATADGTASAASDYTAKSGTLTFPAGAFSATITVAVKGDTAFEPDETFFVSLSNPVNATILDGQGVGTIRTDEFDTPSLVVNTTSDAVDNTDGVISLREAIAYADSNPDQSTITFNIPAAQKTGGVWIINTGGVLTTNENTIITGPGTTLLTIKENDASKSFAIFEAHKDLSVSGLTISSGSTGLANTGTGTATLTNCVVSGNTTGIYSQGTAVLTGCTVSNNSGDAIYNNGTATATNCTLSSNGNGLINNSGDTATVTNCTISGDSNGIVSFGTVTVTNCTLSGSSNSGIQISAGTVSSCTISGSGYGLINFGTSTISNCTLNGNSIGILGNSGTATVTNCTITGSSNTGFLNVSPATLNNSLVVGNATNVGGGTAPGGSNNITTGTAADAGLDPAGLKSNGGPTQTIALIVGSPAIDAASDANAPSTDQRGITRPQGAHSDIGAFEWMPTLSINDKSVTEGNTGTANATFTVTLSPASGQTVTVNYTTADGTAKAGLDYTAKNGTLTFAPGETTKPVTVAIKGDALDEPNETFKVTLSNPNHATIADGLGVGTIIDDDARPTFSIDDVTVTEGDAGTVAATFHLTLSAASGRTVTVAYKTADGTATAGVDYVAIPSTTLTYTPGQTSKTITVLVNGDTLDEANETFKVVLQTATNAAIPDIKGVGTITDNDPLPVLTIGDAVAVSEDGAGAHNALFTVTLTGATGRTATANYSTAEGTAKAGLDYTATSGTVTFSPGQTSKTIVVPALPDTLDEANETFKVNLAGASFATIGDSQGIGTITDNDPTPNLSINDVTQAEGSSGTTDFSFTVTLSKISGQTVTVNYATADGTAKRPADYTLKSGTLTFAAGQTSKIVTIAVIGDAILEANETFFVNLSGPVNATLGDGQGLGTITSDD